MADKTDRFNIVRKGYCPEDVDAYLDTVKDYLTKLEANQKSSMKEIDRLTNSLIEYKQKELSINNAIVNSQISADGILQDARNAADDIVKNAKNEANNTMQNARNAADDIVKNAKNEAQITKEAIDRLLSDIVVSMKPHRKIMQDFRREYADVLTKYLKEINDDDFDDLVGKLDSLENYIGDLTANE